MKNTAKFFSILFIITLACMCGKNEIDPSSDDINKNETGLVTIKAVVPDTPDTKVSFGQGTDMLSLSWSEGDALMVVGNTSEVYDIQQGFDGHEAEFTGNAVEGDSFTVYYPASYATADDLTARSYTGQVQNGNGSLAHLEYNALASGLTDYSEIDFSAAGTLCNGVLKLVVTLPDNVSKVSSIKLSTTDNIFYTTNGTASKASSLSLGLENCTIGNDHVLTAYMMTSWQDVTITGNTKLTLDVSVPGKTCHYTKTFHNPNDLPLNGGGCLNIDISDATVLNHTLAGAGTETDPYQLWDAEDMVAMNALLVADQVTYFKMMDNIDMQGIDWVGGNQASPYTQHMNFDGNNKTISNLTCSTSGVYQGLVGVLSGKVANVTFKNPAVLTSTKCAGVVCGYAGTSGTKPAIVENVTITEATITQNGSSGCHTGLVFGHSNIAGCVFKNITADGTIYQNGTNDSGLIGGAQNIGATFTNCHTSGTITLKSELSTTKTATNICTGGIQGYSAASTFENCSFTGTINAGRLCGGIVGFNSTAGMTISNCHVNAAITSVKFGEAPGEQVGGIAGWVESTGIVSECTFKGSITAAGNNVGGIAGNFLGAKIEKCSNCATINSNGYVGGIVGHHKGAVISECTVQTKDGSKISNSSGNNVGGIVGWNETGDITKCSVNMDISAPASYTGGIVGNFYAGKISECWYGGNLSGADCTGGIAGIQGVSAGTSYVIIENCYSSGKITSSGQKVGGIVGESYQYSKLIDCYSTMAISGSGRVFGNIAGRFHNNKWDGSLDADYNMYVTNCIAAGSINSTATNVAYGSSGAVLANANATKAHYTNCWRTYGYSFNCAYAAGATLVDQGYTVTSYTVGTWAASAGGSANWWPYHASEASASALQTAYAGWTTTKADGEITVSDIASAINHSDSNAWKSDIWDLSEDYPTLKNCSEN